MQPVDPRIAAQRPTDCCSASNLLYRCITYLISDRPYFGFVGLVISNAHDHVASYSKNTTDHLDRRESGTASRERYSIDLPGSLHMNKIPVILGRYPRSGIFLPPKNCSSGQGQWYI